MRPAYAEWTVSGPWVTRQFRVFAVNEPDSFWELDTPRFRVDLHGSEANTTYGSSGTYDIIGADVLRAIDRANAERVVSSPTRSRSRSKAPSKRSQSRSHGRGLIWLVDRDGNDVPHDEPALAEAQEQMPSRRNDPVRGPAAHRTWADLGLSAPPTS